MRRNRTLPLALAVPVAAGCDPGVIEIADTALAVGADLEIDDWGNVVDPCEFSPHGQHEYAGPRGETCRWCRKPSMVE